MIGLSGNPSVVCFPFVGDVVGGSHISALKLIRQIDRRRYQPLVVVHEPHGAVASLFRAEQIAFEPAPVREHLAGRRLGSDLRCLLAGSWTMARFLRARRVRIVHSNAGRSHATWALPARLAGARQLWHHRKDPDAKGLRYLAPLVAARVVSVSQFSAPKPGLWSAAGRCTVVHSPFDTDRAPVDRAASRRSVAEALGAAPGARVVGYFGSLVQRKRPLTFVDAIARLRALAPDLPLVAPLFGEDLEGLAPAIMARARELGVGDCIRLMGFRYPPETWMAACDLLLVTAVDEPFGRTLIEAMLLGTPVIAAASGGNPEAIDPGRTGELVPADDARAFARSARDLLTDRDRWNAISRTACAGARARFGLERHAEAVMAIYDQMLAGQPAAQAAAMVRP
jgi:glycosyltransferase involved in cell wall biosynthesis